MIQKREWGRGYAARGGFLAKSHSTTTQYVQLRRLQLAWHKCVTTKQLTLINMPHTILRSEATKRHLARTKVE